VCGRKCGRFKEKGLSQGAERLAEEKSFNKPRSAKCMIGLGKEQLDPVGGLRRIGRLVLGEKTSIFQGIQKSLGSSDVFFFWFFWGLPLRMKESTRREGRNSQRPGI